VDYLRPAIAWAWKILTDPDAYAILDTVIRADARLTSEICLCERTETITRSSASSQIKITA
jgi:hypothetical protein